MARANIKAEISADASKFNAAMSRAQSLAKSTGKAVGVAVAAGAAIGAAAIGVMSVALIRGAKSAADLGGRMSDLAARTGMSAGSAQVLERAFRDAGISGDKLAISVNRLQRQIIEAVNGNDAAKRSFDRLGLSVEDLEKLSPEDQFQAVARAISRIEDPARRAAASMDIFGRSGGDLLTLFSDSGALDNAAKSIGKQSEILDRRAADFDRISDLLAGAGDKLGGFYVGFLDAIADPILTLLEKFDELDLAEIGQTVGGALKEAATWALETADSVVKIWQRFQQGQEILKELPNIWGDVIDFMGAYSKILWVEFMNVGKQTFSGLLAAFGQLMREYGKMFATVFGIVQKPDFWKGLGNTLGGIAVSFVGRLTQLLGIALSNLADLPIPGLKKRLDGIAQTVIDAGNTMANKGTDMLVEGVPELGSHLAEIGKQYADSVGKVWKAASDGFQAADTDDTSKARQDANNQFMQASQQLQDIMGQEIPGLNLDRIKDFFEKPQEIISEAPIQSPRAPLGSDNVFARDRERLGIASGLTTGGLGEKRRVGREKDAEASKKQEELQKGTNERLYEIHQDIRQALTVG